MKKNNLIIIFISILYFAFLFGKAQEQIKFRIIVNKENLSKSISKEELEKIFLKKDIRWEDGTKIYPVDLIESSNTREIFTDEIHGKKVSAIKAYSQKQIFTGRGVPPPEKSSEKEVLEYVEKMKEPSAIFQKNKSISKYDVKEIMVIEE